MDSNGQGGNLCKTDQSEEQPSELSGQHVEECEKQKTRKDTRKVCCAIYNCEIADYK